MLLLGSIFTLTMRWPQARDYFKSTHLITHMSKNNLHMSLFISDYIQNAGCIQNPRRTLPVRSSTMV